MTVLCGGGTSSGRPGFGLAVQVTTAQIAATLNNIPTPQAVAAAGFIGAINYELSTFCNTDPPPMPTMGALDWLALFSPFPLPGHFEAIAKFQDLLANIYWPVFCKCDSTTTPAAPALPAPPTNLPTFQPPQVPVAPSGGSCWHGVESAIPFTGVGLTPIDWRPLLWADPLEPLAANNNRHFAVGSMSSLQVTQTYHNGAGSNPTTHFVQFTWAQPDGTVLATNTFAPAQVNGVPLVATDYPPTGAGLVTINISMGGGTPPWTGTMDLDVQMFCTGQGPSTPISPCCPPDPSLSAALENMQALLLSIYQSLPSPLTSYADATVHTGLSGNGTLTLVDSPLAVRVAITTDVNKGDDVGSPTFRFDRGYIVPIVNSAPIRGETRLVYNPQMYILPSLTEQIGYSLTPGEVISITELVRGP